MTLGNMRANGVRSLDVSCWQCHHRAILSADPWFVHVPVLTFAPQDRARAGLGAPFRRVGYSRTEVCVDPGRNFRSEP
jgi:hypothetical protein